jgi:hypothetical protein
MAIPKFVKTRAKKAAVPIGLVGGLVLLFSWMLSHLGAGVGTGSGPGNPDSHSGQSATTQPAEPIEVTIRGDGYFVGAAESTIDKIVADAAARSGEPAVKIVAGPDSRRGAEHDLEKSLDDAHITWALDAEPVATP